LELRSCKRKAIISLKINHSTQPTVSSSSSCSWYRQPTILSSCHHLRTHLTCTSPSIRRLFRVGVACLFCCYYGNFVKSFPKSNVKLIVAVHQIPSSKQYTPTILFDFFPDSDATVECRIDGRSQGRLSSSKYSTRGKDIHRAFIASQRNDSKALLVSNHESKNSFQPDGGPKECQF
jgi:hypothetical protein